MTLSRRTPHLTVQARHCLILTTLTSLLLVPALQAAVNGFFVTDLSTSGLVALALICGSRYLGGRTVHTHRPGTRVGICAALLIASTYELVTLSTDRSLMSIATHVGVIVSPLLLMIGLWMFTAQQTHLGTQRATPEPATE